MDTFHQKKFEEGLFLAISKITRTLRGTALNTVIFFPFQINLDRSTLEKVICIIIPKLLAKKQMFLALDTVTNMIEGRERWLSLVLMKRLASHNKEDVGIFYCNN